MRALITGITGQDGSYLADQLLEQGYEVHGVVRRTSGPPPWRIAHLVDHPRVHLHDGDLLDGSSLLAAVQAARPTEVYHLAAQSFVGRSWREPEATAQVTGLGALRLLEAVRHAAPDARVYQASTSEMYGDLTGTVASAEGPFHPRSPYGTAKLFAHTTAIAWRGSYGMHVSTGILFNHESPRRGEEFVTRKIAAAAARASRDPSHKVRLGNLDARRDWGWAPDFVEAMWRLLRHDAPADLIVATGESHSVRDLCRVAFGCVGLDWQAHTEVDPALLRPHDIEVLCGDPRPAEALIGWRPTVGFEELVARMVAAEVGRLGG